MGVGDSDCIILGRTTLFKLLMGNVGLHECRQFWILFSFHCLKYLTWTSNFYTVLRKMMLPACLVGTWFMYSHMYSKFSAFSYFVPIYLTILNCILSKPLCQYHSGRGAAVQNEKHHIHSTYFTFFD
jgi:hypothetical protein